MPNAIRAGHPQAYAARAAVAAALLAALAGCGTVVGPNYKVPATAAVLLPEASQPFASADNPTFASKPLPAHWWRLYQDPQLDGLVARALQANTDLRVASANLARARAAVEEVEAAGRPVVGASAATGYGRASGAAKGAPNPLPEMWTYDASVTVSYQFDLFGKLARAVEAARADTDAAQAAYDLARVTVAADTTRAYADACSAGAQLNVAQRSVKLQQEFVDLTERRVKAGRGTAFDVTRARAQLEQLRAALPPFAAQHRTSLLRLAALTGDTPSAAPRVIASSAASAAPASTNAHHAMTGVTAAAASTTARETTANASAAAASIPARETTANASAAAASTSARKTTASASAAATSGPGDAANGMPSASLLAAVAGCTTAPHLTTPVPVGDGAALLRRRPDIRQAERNLAAATARIGIATADLYPSVSLGLSAGTTGALASLGDANAFRWSLGPLISWTIPNTGSARARIAQSEAIAGGALARFDGTVLNALRETETALTVYARELDRHAALQAARDQSALAAQQAHTLFNAGRSDFLSTLDTDRSLAAADSALAASAAALASDQVALFLALGGGWEP